MSKYSTQVHCAWFITVQQITVIMQQILQIKMCIRDSSNTDQPDEVNRLIEKFISEVDRRGVLSLNLLTGFTGLFSLGHAGFMLIGTYIYAIFTISSDSRDAVYQYYDAAPPLPITAEPPRP